jgi:hypothetical protein
MTGKCARGFRVFAEWQDSALLLGLPPITLLPRAAWIVKLGFRTQASERPCS